MTIGKLRTLILLGNVTAVATLFGVGGNFLWRKVLVGPLREAPIKFKAVKVSDSGDRKTARREDYRHAWNLPIVPDQQPTEKRATVEPGIDTTEFTAEDLRKKLAEAFELRLCSPDTVNPGKNSYAALTLRRPIPNQSATLVVKINTTHLGMEVVDILPDAVLFEFQEVRAALDFVGDAANVFTDMAGGGPGGSNSFDATPVSNQPSGTYAFVEKAKKLTDKGGLVVWQVSQEEQQYLRRNYQRLMAEVKAVPHMDKNGKMDGIELQAIDKSSIIAKRGFQDRDVVKSINGEPVTDMAKLPALFRKHRTSGELVVVYERRGVERTTTYKIPQK